MAERLPDIYRPVRAALIEQGSSLNRWCRENGEHRQQAEKVLKGELCGPMGIALRRRLAAAAGLEMHENEGDDRLSFGSLLVGPRIHWRDLGSAIWAPDAVYLRRGANLHLIGRGYEVRVVLTRFDEGTEDDRVEHDFQFFVNDRPVFALSIDVPYSDFARPDEDPGWESGARG